MLNVSLTFAHLCKAVGQTWIMYMCPSWIHHKSYVWWPKMKELQMWTSVGFPGFHFIFVSFRKYGKSFLILSPYLCSKGYLFPTLTVNVIHRLVFRFKVITYRHYLAACIIMLKRERTLYSVFYNWNTTLVQCITINEALHIRQWLRFKKHFFHAGYTSFKKGYMIELSFFDFYPFILQLSYIGNAQSITSSNDPTLSTRPAFQQTSALNPSRRWSQWRKRKSTIITLSYIYWPLNELLDTASLTRWMYIRIVFAFWCIRHYKKWDWLKTPP